MSIFRIIVLIFVIIFVGIQFIPVEKNQSEIISESDFIRMYETSEEISLLLQISCYDCHSNNTNYPWYNNVQPIAWFLEDHIKEGKQELNYSEWGNYSDRRKRSKLTSMISQIEDDEMPLYSYALVHRDAVLSSSEKELLKEYLSKLLDNL